MNNNARTKTSEAWGKTLSKYNISGSSIEPYHSHQIPVERRIQDIKEVTRSIMDHTGSPNTFWELTIQYAISLLNHTSSGSLG